VDFQSICVLGLGYIGLPTASTFATHGMQVVGVDVNQRVVEVLRNGEIHIHEPGLRTLVQAAFRSGNLKVSEVPEPANAFVIAVPTPILEDKRADMRYVEAAAESILPHLRVGNLVVLESTSPPRTTLDRLAPILERSGLKAGEDFYLAYSAERVLPGKILQELIENARVVGGVNQASAEAARSLYATFVRGDIHLTDATTAEMVKLMENTYRDINIAVANEYARLGERLGVDIWQAIRLANLHPRVNILRPGPGVGGHCISVDPWFLVEVAPEQCQLIRQAREVNDAQPGYVVRLVERALNGLNDKTVAALGLTYKADVDDLRESPALAVVQQMAAAGVNVRCFEPFVPAIEVEGAICFQALEDALLEADAVLLLVDHAQFRSLEPGVVAGQMPGRVAVDARGVWSAQAWEAAGYAFFRLGAGEG
jgi:UDP-N-acetyl-D-mannosaminuronic acid dehydrogenase